MILGKTRIEALSSVVTSAQARPASPRSATVQSRILNRFVHSRISVLLAICSGLPARPHTSPVNPSRVLIAPNRRGCHRRETGGPPSPACSTGSAEVAREPALGADADDD